MVLVNKVKYVHGFAVIPKELTIASGRGNNQVAIIYYLISCKIRHIFFKVAKSAWLLDVLSATPHSTKQPVRPKDFAHPTSSCDFSGCGHSQTAWL